MKFFRTLHTTILLEASLFMGKNTSAFFCFWKKWRENKIKSSTKEKYQLSDPGRWNNKPSPICIWFGSYIIWTDWSSAKQLNLEAITFCICAIYLWPLFDVFGFATLDQWAFSRIFRHCYLLHNIGHIPLRLPLCSRTYQQEKIQVFFNLNVICSDNC